MMARTPTTPPIAPAITPTALLGWVLPATKPLVAGNGDGVAEISHISVEEEFIQGFPESLQIDHFGNKSPQPFYITAFTQLQYGLYWNT